MTNPIGRNHPVDVWREVPVLFAGGGLVGLSTAMFLAQHGIASLAVERLRGGSPVPRAAFFHMRTLEMFRSAGIEEQVRRQSLKEFAPEGAIVLMDSLAGKQLAGLIPSLNEGVDALSPCRRLFVTQPGLEPILRARAEQAGAEVLEGHEVVGVEQDADGVTTTIKTVENGHAAGDQRRHGAGKAGHRDLAHQRPEDRHLQDRAVHRVPPFRGAVPGTEHGDEYADADDQEQAVTADELAGENHDPRG